MSRREQHSVTEQTHGCFGGSTHTRFITHPFVTSLTTGAGTDTATTAGVRFYAKLFIPHKCTLTGIGFLTGSTIGTDKAIVALHDAAGQLVANSATAGTTITVTAGMQDFAFTAPIPVEGPAYYFVAIQFNGTTAKLRTMAAATSQASVQLTGTVAGTFGTLAKLTPPTTFTADVGPVAYTY